MSFQTEALNDAVARFLRTHQSCTDPDLIRDRCEEVSSEFVAHLADTGLQATVVSGLKLQNRPGGGVLILAGHYAALVGSDVYDWTARQFDPAAPVPLVTPYDQWRQTWTAIENAAK